MEKFYPFSVLDTRTKKWKDNDRMWIDKCNIKSELGRENVISKSGFWETPDYASVFSPTLCQIMYEWFCPPNGSILDPFSGGSVRGIIASDLQRDYTGIDLSQKQIDENRSQSDVPNWIAGDAETELQKMDDESYDFVFTCPPYHDLEIYSDNVNDLSNMNYQQFLYKLDYIIGLAANKLKTNRFFALVVSEIRTLTTTHNYSIGNYKGFVSDIQRICDKHNLYFYNDMILFNSQHQASRTVGTYFNRNRKCASVHQNVLVFVKGNPDIATEDITWDGTYVCTINGTDYKSFREAAITLDPNVLVATEVERRCKSVKSKYKDWQTIGRETKPIIKYTVDGIPFESPTQIAEVLSDDFTLSMVNTRINSNNALYRGWKRVENRWTDISYESMIELQNTHTYAFRLPVIVCEGKYYYSLAEAARNHNVTAERIRQKLIDTKFSTWNYLK